MLIASFFLASFFLIILVLTSLSKFLSEESIIIREEGSSYECGFELCGSSRVPFSMRYLFLTLIFLLFDLEIILIVFLPYSFIMCSFYVSVAIGILVLLFLFLSLIYEWNDGTLDWLN